METNQCDVKKVRLNTWASTDNSMLLYERCKVHVNNRDGRSMFNVSVCKQSRGLFIDVFVTGQTNVSLTCSGRDSNNLTCSNSLEFDLKRLTEVHGEKKVLGKGRFRKLSIV